MKKAKPIVKVNEEPAVELDDEFEPGMYTVDAKGKEITIEDLPKNIVITKFDNDNITIEQFDKKKIRMGGLVIDVINENGLIMYNLTRYLHNTNFEQNKLSEYDGVELDHYRITKNGNRLDLLIDSRSTYVSSLGLINGEPNSSLVLVNSTVKYTNIKNTNYLFDSKTSYGMINNSVYVRVDRYSQENGLASINSSNTVLYDFYLSGAGMISMTNTNAFDVKLSQQLSGHIDSCNLKGVSIKTDELITLEYIDLTSISIKTTGSFIIKLPNRFIYGHKFDLINIFPKYQLVNVTDVDVVNRAQLGYITILGTTLGYFTYTDGIILVGNNTYMELSGNEIVEMKYNPIGVTGRKVLSKFLLCKSTDYVNKQISMSEDTIIESVARELADTLYSKWKLTITIRTLLD